MVSAIVADMFYDENDVCLNPYYTGRWFLLKLVKTVFRSNTGLNPYYTGRWFLLIRQHP